MSSYSLADETALLDDEFVATDDPVLYQSSDEYQYVGSSPLERMASQHSEVSSETDTLLPINVVRESAIKRHGKTSTIGATFNIVAATVGAGILSLPGGVASFGWIAVLVVLFITVSASHTAKLLIRCMHLTPGKRLNTYRDIGEAALGKAGGIMTLVIQCITLFGVCTIFLILIGGNMSAVIPQLTFHDFVLIAGILLIPITWLKTLREVAFLSYFGVCASIFCALVVIALGLQYAIDDTPPYQIVSSAAGFFQAFNVIVFSYGGHSVLPTVENDMRHPKRFPFAINCAFGVITSVYFTVASVGYAGWGQTMQGGGGNVLNYASASCDGCVIVSIAYVVISLHVFLAIPVPLNPLNLYLEHALNFHLMEPLRETISRILLRTFVLLSIIAVAMAVPFFGDFLSLISAISTIAMVFVLPILFYVILARRNNVSIPIYHMAFIGFLFVFGVFASIVGLYVSVRSLGCDFATQNPYVNFFVPASTAADSMNIAPAKNSTWCF